MSEQTPTELTNIALLIPDTIAAYKAKRVSTYCDLFGKIDFDEELKNILHCVTVDVNGELYIEELDTPQLFNITGLSLIDIAEEVQKEIVDFLLKKRFKGNHTFFELRCTRIVGNSAFFNVMELITDDSRFI